MSIDPVTIMLFSQGLMVVSQAFFRTKSEWAAEKRLENQQMFQREQFETQKEEQRLQAAEQRKHQWQMAENQRKNQLDLLEAQKIFDNWPLRLLPSNILKTNRGKGPVPLCVFLSIPHIGESDLEHHIGHGLQQFLSKHYNFNRHLRPVRLLNGAWKDTRFHGAASIKALHDKLHPVPILVLETSGMEHSNELYSSIAYWGPDQEDYIYQPVVNIPWREMVEKTAKARALKWRDEREQLIALGKARDDKDTDPRLLDPRAKNLKILEQAEALIQAGHDSSNLELPPYQLTKNDFREFNRHLTAWHCLFAGWIADMYHFQHNDVVPVLPKLLPELIKDGFPQELLDEFLNHYRATYHGLAANRPAWAPELSLQLVQTLTALPDKTCVKKEIDLAVESWLALRGLTKETDKVTLESFLARVASDPSAAALAYQDSGFLERLCEGCAALGDQVFASRVAHVLDQARAWHDELAYWHKAHQGNGAPQGRIPPYDRKKGAFDL